MPAGDFGQHFTLRDPFKGEVPYLSFHGPNGHLGSLWIKDGQMVFEGNADESARIFFESLRMYSVGRLKVDVST